MRPPHKVTDYSSSSEESGTTDEEDDEEVDQEAGEESTSGAEDSRAGYVHLTRGLCGVFISIILQISPVTLIGGYARVIA